MARGFQRKLPMSAAMRPGGEGVVSPKDAGGGGLSFGSIKGLKPPAAPKMPVTPKMPAAPKMPRAPRPPSIKGFPKLK